MVLKEFEKFNQEPNGPCIKYVGGEGAGEFLWRSQNILGMY